MKQFATVAGFVNERYSLLVLTLQTENPLRFALAARISTLLAVPATDVVVGVLGLTAVI